MSIFKKNKKQKPEKPDQYKITIREDIKGNGWSWYLKELYVSGKGSLEFAYLTIEMGDAPTQLKAEELARKGIEKRKEELRRIANIYTIGVAE